MKYCDQIEAEERTERHYERLQNNLSVRMELAKRYRNRRIKKAVKLFCISLLIYLAIVFLTGCGTTGATYADKLESYGVISYGI